MTRLTMLFIAVALVLPGAALATPAREGGAMHPQAVVLDESGIDQAAARRKAEAVGRYYASFRDEQSLPPKAPAPLAADDDGVSYSIAIGAGIGLILLAGGLGVYAGRMVRPRRIGA